jgi:hypothetical protein
MQIKNNSMRRAKYYFVVSLLTLLSAFFAAGLGCALMYGAGRVFGSRGLWKRVFDWLPLQWGVLVATLVTAISVCSLIALARLFRLLAVKIGLLDSRTPRQADEPDDRTGSDRP